MPWPSAESLGGRQEKQGRKCSLVEVATPVLWLHGQAQRETKRIKWERWELLPVDWRMYAYFEASCRHSALYRCHTGVQAWCRQTF